MYSPTRQHLDELLNASAVVTSSGDVTVTYTQELCGACTGDLLIFPFDRCHCSLKLSIGETVGREMGGKGPLFLKYRPRRVSEAEEERPVELSGVKAQKKAAFGMKVEWVLEGQVYL